MAVCCFFQRRSSLLVRAVVRQGWLHNTTRHRTFLHCASQGHSDVVNGLAWSPDCRMLATACDDMAIRIFDVSDVTNNNPKFKFINTKQPPLAVGFGNDSNSVVAVLRGTRELVQGDALL